MRALTVRQPHASLIIAGVKPVENRTWPVPKTLWKRNPPPSWPNGDLVDYDSPFPFRIAIHAGKQYDYDAAHRTDLWGIEQGRRREEFDIVLGAHDRLGVLLGYVTVTGCHHARDCAVTAGEYDGTNALDVFFACTDWAEPWQIHDADGDLYHWTLADPVALDEPIPMRGRQGLWNVPDDALAEVAA